MSRFTHAELYDAFARVCNKSDFWGPLFVRVSADAVSLTAAAIAYFTGRDVKARRSVDGRDFWLKTC